MEKSWCLVLLPSWRPFLLEVVVAVESVDVCAVPVAIRHVTWALSTSEEHGRLDVEVTPSVQQWRDVIPEFTHTGFSAGAERSSRWSMFGQWWERLRGEIIDSDDPDVEQLGEMPRRSGHGPCHDKDGHCASESGPVGDGCDCVVTDKRRVPVFTLGDDEVLWLATERGSPCDHVGFEPE